MEINMNKLKRAVSVGLSVMMLSSAVAASHSFSADAAGKKAKAIKAYREYLASGELGTKMRCPNENLKFSAFYLDKDKIPELVVYKEAGAEATLYTYKNNSVKEVASLDFGVVDKKLCYYKKTGVFVDKSLNVSIVRESYNLMKGAGFTTKLHKGERMSMTATAPTYFIHKGSDEKVVSVKKFKKALKKLTKGKKKTKVKFYTNNETNRKKRIK